MPRQVVSDTKMLQILIDGQGAIKEELLQKIGEVGQKVDKLDQKIDKVEQNLTNRIDKLGSQLAYLEDDTPTREEHDKLEKRVIKIENML